MVCYDVWPAAERYIMLHSGRSVPPQLGGKVCTSTGSTNENLNL